MTAGFPFPWNQFERLFGIRPPGNIAELALDADRLDAYVREEIDRCLRTLTASSGASGRRDTRPPVRTAEIGRTVTVRFAVPSRIPTHRLRIRANRWFVRLEAPPEFGPRTVRLPAAVDPSTGQAVRKQGFVEIRFAKGPDEPFRDVTVRTAED